MQITLPPGHTDSASPPMRGLGLPPGTRLGEFEIGEIVGEGGFGVVYLARDHLLGRPVAIKEFMPSALASRQADGSVLVRSERHQETFRKALDSFINEARLLASFDHPALVKVYQFWEGNGTAYMVMPYLQGVTLRAAMDRRDERPTEDWLLALLDPVTDALGMIHARGCWHRDVAPDNILLLDNGRPVLLDFGAARRVIGDMTQDLTVILKPGYAPVEQYASGPDSRQGPWTDVYALGALVYFCATGRTPVPAITRMMKDTLEPFSTLTGGRYSERFAKAIDHALAVQAEERTESVHAFREEIGLPTEFAAPTTRSWPSPEFAANAASAGFQPVVDREADGPSAAPAPDPEAQYRRAGADASAGPRRSRSRGPLWVGVLVTSGLVAVLGAGYLYLNEGDPAPGAASVEGRLPPKSAGDTSTQAGANAAPTPVASEPARTQPIGRESGQSMVGPAPAAAAPSSTVPALPAVVPPPAALAPAAPVLSPAAPVPSAPLPPPVAALPPSPGPQWAAAPPEAPLAPTPTVFLERLFELRDPAWQVDVDLRRSVVRIGSDAIEFAIRSERAGYVYVLMRGTDDAVFQLFPNALDRDNRIRPRQELTLPRPSWSITAAGPPGENRFVAIVSPSRRSFDGVGLGRQDPIGQFDMSILGRALESTSASGISGNPTGCDAAQVDCASFGAARFEIRETFD